MEVALLPPSSPVRVLWTDSTGKQVIRKDWSTPRDVVNSSLGDTADNSDCVCTVTIMPCPC